MNIKQSIINKVERTEIGKQFIGEQRSRIILFAVLSFFLNLLYAFYNGALGIINHSVWFITMCAYYIVLSTMRLSAILCGQKNKNISSSDTEYFVMKLCGVLLVLLNFVLVGAIYISLSRNIATKHGEIVMITIATYTFYKITVAVIRAIKQRKNAVPLLDVIRTIGYAEVAASLLTLQRSMLISFGSTGNEDIALMNSLTGISVCLFILLLGIFTILTSGKERKNTHGTV